jgi:hypothetical protein
LVDISDPIVWSTVVQTIVLTLTLVIFIFTFRSQNQAIREQAYGKVLDDYGTAMKMLVETPELLAFQRDLFNTTRGRLGREPQSFTREELVVRNYVIMLYGFFERVYFLYRRKWIDEDTWRQWAAFLELFSLHPVFREVHQSSGEMWDKPFVDYVANLLDRKPEGKAKLPKQ